MTSSFTPYSTVKPFMDITQPWMPPEVRERVASYLKYDEMYWNDDSQFLLRVLQGEHPIYIPNARTVVDTTSYYLLKGLQITINDPQKYSGLNAMINDLLDREMFYPRFHIAKHAGVARGDFCFHVTADPKKSAGKRISLTSVDPCMVIPVYDDDDCDKVIRVHIIDLYTYPNDPQQYLKKLTYEYVTVNGETRIKRGEGIYKLDNKWWGSKPIVAKILIPDGLLPSNITTIPVYWFKNMDWQGQQFGSSELRGIERLFQGISQAATDQEASLGLEGLGVYATDGGRPVRNDGTEEDWEISPGKVMEVPSGSYFRRVEGLTTMKPSMDHINYLESKIREATGLSDVALGRVDVQTAQSGIALAIKFIPTLAKVEERDTAGLAKLKQLFYDIQTFWYPSYEGETFDGKIVPVIGEKLPEDRTAKVNELNNMLDRRVISIQYYRAEMQKLGYEFPDDIQQQIDAEQAKQIALTTPPELAQNALDATTGAKPPPPGNGNSTLPKPGNQSNNKGKPNESAGTESGQSLSRQARGGKP